mmetsp:Transcript_4/g.8  ORF Transcript_4/g.8 Transcript_4/m.8 type:complete len:465 (-) Transcript_4:94-1488(-)
MANSSKKTKTILRVKRKFSDIEQPVDTIVLSRRLPLKKRRTIEWNDLTAAFNDNLSIKHSAHQPTTEDANHKLKNIPNFFDFDFEKEVKTQSVFRLMKSERVAIANSKSEEMYQTAHPHPHSNKTQTQVQVQAQAHGGVIHHEDIDAAVDSECDTDAVAVVVSRTPKIKANAKKNGNIHFVSSSNCNGNTTKLELLKQKLLHKQTTLRCTKIASKAQLRTHQHALQCSNHQLHCNVKKQRQRRTIARAFDVVKDNFDIIDIEYDAQQQRYIESLCDDDDDDIVDEEKQGQEEKEENVDNYDFYELDENADAEQVLRAVQCMQSQQHEQQQHENVDMAKDAENDLALEWRLESIKNKHLKKLCKQSEIARLIELEQCAMDRYFENVHDIDSDEMERDDENFPDNEYPDKEEEEDAHDGCDEYAQFDDDDDDYNTYGADEIDRYDNDDDHEQYYLQNNTLDLEFNI